MATRDRNTIDLSQQKLCIAPDVMFWPVREQGELVYRIEIPKLHRFFRVGYEEYVFLSLLDGQTTIPQACGLAASKLGSRAPTTEQAKTIARWLLTNGLAHLQSDPPPTRNRKVSEPANFPQPILQVLGKVNPFWIKVPLPLSERWINSCSQHCRFLFSGVAITIAIGLMLVAALMLVNNWREFSASTTDLFHPGNWFWLLATWVVLKVVHELAHAVACNLLGGSVREAGLVFVLFAPLAYVDVSSCWRMPSRWSRIAVALAGMYVELVVAAVAILAWYYIDAPYLKFLLHNIVIVAGLTTLVFNANVLMRFDGYFALADLLDIPNLYGEASSAVSRKCWRVLTGQPVPRSNIVGWRRQVVFVYGLAALFWRITICLSLGIAASAMFAGAGIVLTAIGILIWVGTPLTKFFRQMIDLRSQSPNQFGRACGVSATAVVMAIWFVGWFPIPTAVSVAAITQYAPNTVVRCRVSGFVKAVHVQDGTSVDHGDLLAELENRNLVVELDELKIERAQNQIRMRQATKQHDAAALQVLHENQRATIERIEQLQAQVDALQIVAPHDGVVVARCLDSHVGTYMSEGDQLLVVANSSDKEITAMIGHADVEAVTCWIGHDVPIRPAGFRSTMGRLVRIEPRATRELPSPALAATHGGLLAVESAMAEDQQHDQQLEMRLLHPYFRGRIQLEPKVAEVVPVGVRAEVWLGYRTDTIYRRMFESITKMWRSARSG